MNSFTKFFLFSISVLSSWAGSTPKANSPEEFLKTVEIPEGYSLEVVASEPMIQEPVLISFDHDGSMLVAEMNTYMQDIDSTGEREARCRIVRLRDTDGDGRMDQRQVFADKLILPRSIVPVKGGALIHETGSFDIHFLEDTNQDGVADKKTTVYKGDKFGGNVEHQPGTMIWAMDNWLYHSWGQNRWRWSNGKIQTEEIPASNGQWGLTQTETGQLIFSNAAGGHGIKDLQVPIHYAYWWPSWELDAANKQVFPISKLPDMQGGPGMIKDGGLKRFTGCGGQEVFLGDALPHELYGNVFLPEPVGRLIRRFKLTKQNGRTIAENADPGTEFIRSSDPYFRPVYTKTAPDGSLYIVDMYRGIIQHGHWAQKGTYLRKMIDKHGLDQQVSHGRIYRLVHKDHPLSTPRDLSKSTPAELIELLGHKNAWYRRRAQQLLIENKDKSLTKTLLAKLKSSSKPIQRLHILWTLEGLESLSPQILLNLLKNHQEDTRILTVAIRLSEGFLAQSTELTQSIYALKSHPNSDILEQITLSASKVSQLKKKEFATAIHESSAAEYLQELQVILESNADPIITDVYQDWRYYVTPTGLQVLNKGSQTFKGICRVSWGRWPRQEKYCPLLI